MTLFARRGRDGSRAFRRAALMGSTFVAMGMMAAASGARAEPCTIVAGSWIAPSGQSNYCALSITDALTVSGDAVVTAATVSMGQLYNKTEAATLTVDGANAILTVEAAISFEGAANRRIVVQNGGTLNINSFSQYLDYTTEHSASVEVRGAGSQLNMNSGAMYFAVWGPRGDMTVSDGGRVTMAATSYMATGPQTNSTVVVTGQGSAWEVGGMLEVGREGNATLNVLDGGYVEVAQLLKVADFGKGTGRVLIQGANSAVVANAGSFGVDGAAEVTIRDGGQLAFAGTLWIGGNSAATSSSVINIGGAYAEAATAGGRLDAVAIRFGDNSVLNLNHTGYFASSAQLTSYASGVGTINQMAGRTVLTGDASLFGGITNITGGALTFANSLGGTINVSDAVLVGNGRTGTLNVLADGVYLAKAGSTLSADSGIRFAKGSTLDVEVDPVTGEFGKLHSNGQVTIEGGTVRHVGNEGRYQPQRVFTILTSAGPIVGTFDGVESHYAFLNASLRYESNAVSLVLQRNDIDFSDIGITRNQRAAGAAVSALGFDAPLFNAVIDLSKDDARSAFGQLAGEAHATARTTLLDDSAAIRQAVVPAVRDQAREKGTTSVWFSPVAAKTDFDASSEFMAMETRSQGGLMGADYAVSDSWQVGFVGGFDKGELEAERFESDRDSYHLGLYAKGSRGKLGVRGGYVGSWHDLDGTRIVEFTDLKTTHYSQYEAQTRQAFVEANWAMPVGAYDLSPFVSAAHVSVETDGFEERGANGALRVEGAEQSVVLARVGVAGQRGFDVAGRKAFVAGRVAYENASGDTASLQHQSFGGGAIFRVEGMGYDENAVSAELGGTLSLGRAGAVSVDWQGVYGDQRARNQFSASYRLTF